MDYASILLSGFSSACFAFLGVSLSWFLFRKRIITYVISNVQEYALTIIGELQQKPEILTPYVKPFIDSILKSFAGKDQNGVQLPIGDGIEAILPLLPKKWRALAWIGSKALNLGGNGSKNNSQDSNETNKSPFS